MNQPIAYKIATLCTWLSELITEKGCLEWMSISSSL